MGGSNAQEQQIIKGNTILEPYVIKDGYYLEGWYTSEDLGSTISEMWVFDSTPVTEDLTLYAKWHSVADFSYSIVEHSIKITAYHGNASILRIPEFIEGLPVREIGDMAFYESTTISEVIIPSGVLTIGIGAFSRATLLAGITIPNSVISIGDAAFYGATALSTIILPDGVTEISNYMFKGATSLTNIVIPNSVTSIGFEAFYGASAITSINISNSVTNIGIAAFDDTESLVSINVDGSNQYYKSIDGVFC